MSRPVWKGHISFGLVNIPVQLYTAVRDKTVRLHLLDKDGTCRLRQKLYCPETGKEYSRGETARGAEIAPGQYVILTKEELDQIKPEKGRAIEIDEFVELSSIDPVYFDKPYYLGAAETGEKAYRLLFKAMKNARKAAIARFVMRENEYLAVIRPLEEGLCLETLHYGEEVASFDETIGEPAGAEVKPQELQVAEQLIESMVTEFDPTRYANTYREKIRELIQKKAEGETLEVAEEKPETPAVVDLMGALKQSLEGRRKRGGRRQQQAHP